MHETKIELLQQQLEELKLKFEKQISCPELREIWIPKNELMDFMGFAETQFNEIVNRYKIIYTKIGAKKFYLIESILKVMNSFKNQ